MKKFEAPEIEISEITEDVIATSFIDDKVYDPNSYNGSPEGPIILF